MDQKKPYTVKKTLFYEFKFKKDYERFLSHICLDEKALKQRLNKLLVVSWNDTHYMDNGRTYKELTSITIDKKELK